MIDTKTLREKVLDLAIRGKPVPQDPNDEPASVLLERIRAEKEQMVKDGKLKAKDIKNDTIIFKGDDNLHYEQFSDGTVKCIEDEIPFSAPKGWSWCRLRDLFNVCSAKRVLQSEWRKNGVPFYRAREIVKLSNNGYVDNDLFISEKHYQNLKQTYGVPQSGDLMVTGVGTIGKVYIVKSDDVFYYKDASVLCFENRYGIIAPEYARIMIESPLLQNQIHSKTYGNTVDTITISTANEYLCILPPIKEQTKIIKAVNNSTELISTIENNKSELSGIVAQVKSKILDLAIRGKLVPQNPDDEPVSVLLERIRAEKEELIKQGKIKRDKKESVIFKGEDNSYYEEIPGNWICCNVKSVMQYIRNGATIKQSKDATGIPITRIETISQEFIDYTKMGYANIFEVDNYQSFVLNSGDILMSHINSPKHLCKCAIYNHIEKNEVVLHGMNLLSLRPVAHETSKFLLYMFRSSEFKAYVYENMKHSVNQASITATDIGNYTFLLPPLAEQKRIVEAIEIAFAQLDEILNSIS